MTDKQFIETLRNIQNYCRMTICNHCKLSYGGKCALQVVIRQLDMCPENWNTVEIERLLKEYE